MGRPVEIHASRHPVRRTVMWSDVLRSTMCGRHVAQMIAEYEASRIEGAHDAEDLAPERTGVLATLRARLRS